MSRQVLIVGHKNPDNDSIAAAVGYAYLKNQLAARAAQAHPGEEPYTYEPVRLGPLPPESQWVLESNNIELPQVIQHVHARVSDVMTANPVSICESSSVIEAGHLLRKHDVRALVVTDDDGLYRGLFSMRAIAERYIASTDATEELADKQAVADSLIASLSQNVSDLVDSDVITLNADDLLGEAVEDLLGSALREAVVLDEEGRAIGIVTRTDVATQPKRNVILVDHNESRQAVNGIEEANIMEIIDHHRIGDISTANPIQFLNMPVGSTATIVALQFQANNVEIPKSIAAVLLSAIMTDTVILKSPTATDVDREQVEYLSSIMGVDATEFGLQVFQCRGGERDMPIEEFVGADAKEFQVEDSVVLIAQHETVDLKTALSREEEIRTYMKCLCETHSYEFVLLLVTDILAEGSQFILEGNPRIVNRVFDIKCEQGSCWMPGVLSRKKQVAARILGA